MAEQNKISQDEKFETNLNGIEYLHSIDFKSLSKTVFTDHLATVSETGKTIGELTICVEETVRNEELCYHVHAQSHGEIEGVAMGTSITAYIARGVVTLEQTQHEYIKIPDKPLDKKTVIIKEGSNYIVQQTINEGLTTHDSSIVYPTSLMNGFISEGANIILQRIMIQRQQIPEKAVFTTLDSNTNLAVMKYQKLPDSSLSIDDTTLDVFGIRREIISLKLPLMTWNTYFLSDGLMTSRVTLGSTVHMQLVKLPKENVVFQQIFNFYVKKKNSQECRILLSKRLDNLILFVEIPTALEEEKTVGCEKRTPTRKDLVWEEDMQLHSHFLERKEELISTHEAYINRKPEIRALLRDFCQFLLLRKPDDVCSFAAEYFRGFSTKEKLNQVK